MIACRFLGNPLEEKHSGEGDWREQATKRLPRLKKLDGKNSVSSVLDVLNLTNSRLSMSFLSARFPRA